MNESLNQFDAQSANDLICKLQSYDTCIPNRSSGRKTHHTERWTICRFLHAIANTSVLSYPLCVKHGDRPDLVLGFLKELVRVLALRLLRLSHKVTHISNPNLNKKIPSTFTLFQKLNFMTLRGLKKELKITLNRPNVDGYHHRSWAIVWNGTGKRRLLVL